MGWSVVAIVGGLVVLAWASDQFVTGAARFASIADVSPMLIGVVVLGFGASAPELVVSSLAASRGELDVAVGNIVGSNIVNVALVLPVAALAGPLRVDRTTLRREVPVTAAAAGLFVALLPGGLSRVEGAILVLTLVGLAVALVRARRPIGGAEMLEELEEAADQRDPGGGGPGRWAELARMLVGLAVVVASAHVLVTAAVDLAGRAGLSEAFVGMTILAVGTALPELSTGIVATRRGHGSLVIGNLLGSNVANSLLVGGFVGIVGGGAALGEPGLIARAAIVMAVVFGLGYLMVRSGEPVGRGPALAMVVLYLGSLPILA